MQAFSMPFSNIIDVVAAKDHFHIPKYQREYSWGRKEWEQLLLDIDENEPGYFMGSLICINDTAPFPGGENVYEVVDGQQRFTTLSLLLMALYINLKDRVEKDLLEDDDEKIEVLTTLTNMKKQLIKQKKNPLPGEQGGFVVGANTYFLRVQPSAQNHNLEDYRYILSEIELLKGQIKPKHCGNRSIYKAFRYFMEKLPEEVSLLREMVQKVNQLIFVHITVQSQSDAFTLFESLNNRGVPLSAIDIIKNKLLAEMEHRYHENIDESFDRWQEIIGALPDTVEQERFLRHFYNTFKHRPSIQIEKVPIATRSQTIRIYEALIKRDAKTFFTDFSSKAGIYGNLLHPSEELSHELTQGLIELQRIGAASAYQILLFLFALPQEQLQSKNFLTEAVRLLCRYHIRRNITDTPATRDLDRAAIELIEVCAATIEQQGSLTLETFTQLLLEGKRRPASLEQLRTALEGPIYAENTGMARYLLIQLDLLHQSREYQPNLWIRDDKGRFVWTIEHVLPQAEKLPQQWVQMFGAGDPVKASTLQEKYVHCLGNLTLSGYNSDLATSSFEKKQQVAQDRTFLGHKINIGYRNGLELNKLPFVLDDTKLSLATAPTWSAESIEARTKAMVHVLLKANKLPGEEVVSNR